MTLGSIGVEYAWAESTEVAERETRCLEPAVALGTHEIHPQGQKHSQQDEQVITSADIMCPIKVFGFNRVSVNPDRLNIAI